MPAEEFLIRVILANTIPRPLGGRHPTGDGNGKPQGRLRGEDGKTCRPLRYRLTDIRGVFDPNPRGRYV
jgi:hypothetical protein